MLIVRGVKSFAMGVHASGGGGNCTAALPSS